MTEKEALGKAPCRKPPNPNGVEGRDRNNSLAQNTKYIGYVSAKDTEVVCM